MKIFNLSLVLKYNIPVPYPRWIKGMDQKCCFATNIGWVLLKTNGKKESIMMIKNINNKIQDYINTHNIIVEKDNIDNQFEIEFLRSNIENQNNQEQPIIINSNENITKDLKNVLSDVKFDFIELENDIENKKLRKNNLIRIYLTWSDCVNIRSFDKKKTYIEVFDSKHNKLGNAEYRSRETEKTLMFVYKIGKEKLSNIIINSKIFDGYIRDKNNVLVENTDKTYNFDVNVNF